MEPLMIAEEVANLLNTSISHVYREARLGRLPHYKLGKSVRFKLEEVLEYTKRDNLAQMSERKPKCLLSLVQEAR